MQIRPGNNSVIVFTSRDKDLVERVRSRVVEALVENSVLLGCYIANVEVYDDISFLKLKLRDEIETYSEAYRCCCELAALLGRLLARVNENPAFLAQAN